MKKFVIFTITSLIFFLLVCGLFLLFYIKGLPKVIKSEQFIKTIQSKVLKETGLDLLVVEPDIVTGLNKKINFSIKELKLKKNDKVLLHLENFDTLLSFGKKKITLETLWADSVFTNVDGLIKAFPVNENDKSFDFKFDFFHCILYVKELKAQYCFAKDALALVTVNDLIINALDSKKDIHFDIVSTFSKQSKSIKLSLKDDNKVYIENNKFIADNLGLNIEKSKALINFIYNFDNTYKMSVSSKNFEVNDVVVLINSKLLDESTAELLTYFSDIKGLFDFNINISNNDIDGVLDLKNLSFKLKYIENLPVLLTKGKAYISKDEINLKDFAGYYNNKAFNKINFEGKIKDYFKSFDTNIVANAIVTNDFSKNYFSKLVGYPMEMTGNADTMLVYKSKYDKIDLVWLYKFDKGTGFSLNDEIFGDVDTERVLVSKMHINGPILNIESMDYFMGSPKEQGFNKNSILRFYGNIDMANNFRLKNFGFKINDALSANFINMLLKQNVFRHGTVKGDLEYIDKGNVPVLRGNLIVNKVAVPSQRMFIKEAQLDVKDNLIMFSSLGKYKRSDYKVSGSILNQLKLPIVVKNLDLSVDNLNVERFLASVNNQKEMQAPRSFDVDNTENDDDVPTFDLSTLIVENCRLNLVKGFYKDLHFVNVIADLKFDENQVLDISSNRFEFAKGISSAKIVCDLRNQLYSIKLGIRNVDSDLIALTLFNVKKEISGLASGFIDLNSDKTFKLNGRMGFNIKNGSIAKIGLFQYVLNFTSVFRNPLVSLSPGMFADFVNVPDGNFELIQGSLTIKDNVVKNISITSYARQMAAYIAGKFDLESRDAALRIYIKFSNKNKGFYGILRNFSLNSLANRVPFGAKSSNNYYEREIVKIPKLAEEDEKNCHIYLTKVDGDVENNNFISFLKKLK